MNNLGFQADSAELKSQTKLQFRWSHKAFDSIFKLQSLQMKIRPLVKHAQLRMSQRNTDIAPETWDKIAHKANEAKKMGITEALFITANAALIVSTENNKVIAVMDGDEQHHKFSTKSMEP